jgi:hypothetical protein
MLLILKIHKVIIILLPHAKPQYQQQSKRFSKQRKIRINFSSSLLFKNVINIKCYFSQLDFIVLLGGDAKNSLKNNKNFCGIPIVFFLLASFHYKMKKPRSLWEALLRKKGGVRNELREVFSSLHFIQFLKS